MKQNMRSPRLVSYSAAVQYRVSEVAIGYVCEQSLPPDTETTNGQVIDIVIRGFLETTMPMPNAMDQPLKSSSINSESLHLIPVRSLCGIRHR
jgi:beta-lactam-binding protein with PASTA domain